MPKQPIAYKMKHTTDRPGILRRLMYALMAAWAILRDVPTAYRVTAHFAIREGEDAAPVFQKAIDAAGGKGVLLIDGHRSINPRLEAPRATLFISVESGKAHLPPGTFPAPTNIPPNVELKGA